MNEISISLSFASLIICEADLFDTFSRLCKLLVLTGHFCIEAIKKNCFLRSLYKVEIQDRHK